MPGLAVVRTGWALARWVCPQDAADADTLAKILRDNPQPQTSCRALPAAGAGSGTEGLGTGALAPGMPLMLAPRPAPGARGL